MIFDAEIAHCCQNHNEIGRSHVQKFLDKWAIDRSGLEAFMRRSAPDGKLHYVSTVARGMAGSTSDIDVMAITENSPDSAHNLTQMLFHEQRRIGVKSFASSDVEAALQAVGDRVAAWDAGTLITDPLPIRWSHLERIVNGVTFDGEPDFLGYLPILSRWAAISACVALQKALRCADMALAAGQAGSGRAYGEAVLMAAMDTLMASCGRVQWNSKWIYERWRIFSREAIEPLAREGIGLTEQLREAVMTGPIECAALRDSLDMVGGYFADLFSIAGAADTIRLGCAAEVSCDDFLPGAVVLQTRGKAILVEKSLLDAVQGSEKPLAPDAATLALSLVQQGFLNAHFDRCEHD